jgi:hypothetical protein
MEVKLTRLTHQIVIQLHLVLESCTICSFCSKRLVRKLLDTPSYAVWCVYTSLTPKQPISSCNRWISATMTGAFGKQNLRVHLQFLFMLKIYSSFKLRIQTQSTVILHDTPFVIFVSLSEIRKGSVVLAVRPDSLMGLKWLKMRVMFSQELNPLPYKEQQCNVAIL